MPDVPPPDRPAQRRQTLWELITHPRLTRYRMNQRQRILLLIAYAEQYCQPGILTHSDALITHGIGLTHDLDAFHDLVQDMTARRDLRAVEVDGQRRYEFCRDLVPAYAGDTRDPLSRWDESSAVLTVSTPAPNPFAMESATDGQTRRRGGNHKWEIDVTDAEKVAFSRFCGAEKARAELEGRRPGEISRDKWVVWERARKAGQETERAPDLAQAVTFETPFSADFGESKSYSESNTAGNGLRNLSRGVVAADSGYEREIQQQQSNSAGATPKVTPSKVTDAKVTLTSEQQAVFAFLTSKGLWQDIAQQAALWCDIATAHLYVAWVRSMKNVEDFGKMLRFQLENRHPVPDDFRQQYARKELELQRQGAQRAAAQQRVAQTDAIHARIDQYWSEMSAAEREAVLYQAANNLIGQQRVWWKEFLEKRKTYADAKPPLPLDAVLHRQTDDVLRDRLQLPRLDKTQTPPARFVMPADWDGALPEPGELPPGLGIPDLTPAGGHADV